MTEVEHLSSVQTGETVWIKKEAEEREISRRLMELGIVPGTRMECLYRSPYGDPTAYRVRGTTIALRRKDAERIPVQHKIQEE